MFNPAQRTFKSSVLDFNVQRRSMEIRNKENNEVKEKIKVNKSNLYYKDRVTLED